MVRDIWNEFARKFDAVWAANNRGELVPQPYWDFPGGAEAFAEYRRRYIQRLLQEVAGHGGTKFLRRMMGIVSVWDFTSIQDLEKRAVAERLAIRIGTRWVLERKSVTSIDDLIGIVREEVLRRYRCRIVEITTSHARRKRRGQSHSCALSGFGATDLRKHWT